MPKKLSSKILSAFLLVVLLVVVMPVKPAYANACTWTGATNTAWATTTNWTGCGGATPIATDTVTIPDAATTNFDPTPAAAVTLAGLTIDSGGVFNDGGFTHVLNGPVVLNGTWNGTGRLNLNAVAATLDGSGTFNGDRIDPVSGASTILSTANLTVTRIDVKTGSTVTNNGIVTITTSITGADTTSIWVNAANSTLNMNVTGAVLLATGTLTATANPNTVNYKFAGVQTIKATTYHHLTLSGSGIKTAGGVVTVNGNLSVGLGTTFSTANSVNAGGNWSADGMFNQTAGTTMFTGGGVHTVSGVGSSQFNNLTTSSQTINAGASDIRISGNWTHGTAGIFNEQTSTVTFNGSGAQSRPIITFVPQLYNMTISGGTISARVWTVTNNFLLTNGAIEVSSNSSFKKFTISGGTFTAPTGNINVSGNWTYNVASTFTPGTGTVTFNGSSPQTIGGSASTTFNNLTLNNGSGVSLSGVNATVNGVLTFTSGKITTSANTLILGASGSVTGAGVGNYVYGNLRKTVTTGSPSLTYEVGDASVYAPVSVAFTSVTASDTLTVSTTGTEHPQINAPSFIDSTKDTNRYWTLTPGGTLAYISYDATFNFVSGDVDSGADTTIFMVNKYSTSTSPNWYELVSDSRTTTSVRATSVTSMSDFAIGEPLPGGSVPTPVTLSYFTTMRDGNRVEIEWSTVTESGSVGFNLYAQDGDQRLRLSEELIPSRAADSLSRLDYTFQAETTSGIFYIEDVNVNGQSDLHGPYQLGQVYGSRVEESRIAWTSIQAEHAESQTANKDGLNLEQSGRPEMLSLNLKVHQTGLFRVTYEMLRDAGLDLAGLPAANLLLTNHEERVPMYVAGADPFGTGGFIEFYGQALDTIYTDTNVYTLRVSPTPLDSLLANDMTLGREARGQVTSYIEKLEINNQRAFANYAPSLDAWYDTSMLVYKSAKSWEFPFQVDGLTRSSEAASLELVVWGVTNWPQSPDHNLQVSVNGLQVTTDTFDGLVERTIKVKLPAGLLREGANSLRLTLPADTGVDWDMINLDKFSVTYPRKLQAREGRLVFTAAGNSFTVTNLPSADVVVYRLNAKNSMTRLNRVRVQANRGGTFSAVFSGSPQAAKYLVSTVEAMYAPQFEVARPQADLDRPAQYLIISHPDFINGLQPLIQAREAQGLTVKVVNVTDLYARYTYGIFDPQAIQQYIARAYKELGTQYILLVGGDTYDYRNYLGVNSLSFIPSLYVSTGRLAHFVPADPLYADVNGDNVPDVALGRFPVRTVAELDLMVSKTLAYAEKNYGQTAVFASDLSDGNVSFKNINNAMVGQLPAAWSVDNIHLNDVNVTTARDQLTAAMNRGTALVTFTGHSGPQEWTFSNLFNISNAAALTNHGRPFVVVQWGCWNNYYVDPVHNYLVQSFLFSGDQGAAAVLGASTLTDSTSETLLGELLTPRLTMQGMPIGQALQLAKSELAQSHPELLDVLLGWSLMGDPALVIEP